jgi:hypothetical protein
VRLCPPPGEFWVMPGHARVAAYVLLVFRACHDDALRGGCFIFAAIISQQKTSPEQVKKTAL